jgi:CubicO group peptidase (beta-lactamase class C family)
LAQWLLFHLEPDVQRKVSVLSPARLQELHAAPSEKSENTTPVKSNTPHAPITRYGLGWFFNDHRGHTIVEHSGVQNGFVTWIAMAPSERFGVAILTNRDRVGLNYALRFWLMDACLGFPVSDWSEKVRLDFKNGYQRLLREAEQKFTAEKKQGTTPLHLPVHNPFTNFGTRAQIRKALRAKRLRSSSPVRWGSTEPNHLRTLESAG